LNLPDIERVRLIDAEWQPDAVKDHSNEIYQTELYIYGNNRTGLLVDVSKIFTERDIDIISIHSKTSKQGIATIVVDFGTSNKDELRGLIEKLRQIDSVIDVKRTTG
jgi:GTP pyrophosphokinase